MSDEEDVLNRASERIGTVLRGKYRLDAILGIGGMAVVYAATHRNQKRFAVKMLHAELAVRSELRARFVREGYVANSVAHEGVVSVLDDDVDEMGMAFLVMDLLQGADVELLRSRADGKLPLQLVLTIGAQVLSVLEAAHARGVVHRDLKPANFFVTRAGHFRVLDFGVAQLREDASSVQATRSGAVLGTPSFMAPEQAAAQHREVEARTDLWAIGASMFTLLSGQFVHVAENGGQTLIQAATKPARSLASAAPDLPTSVVALVDKALSFDKAARFESAAAMSEALLAVHRELFGELSREPLRACVAGVEAPRIRVSPSVLAALGESETTADAPLATLFRVQPALQAAPKKSRSKRRAPFVSVGIVLLACTWLMRATSSPRPNSVVVAPQQPTLHAAQPAVAIDLLSTVQASVQTAVYPLPTPPPKLAFAKHPRALLTPPKSALAPRRQLAVGRLLQRRESALQHHATEQRRRHLAKHLCRFTHDQHAAAHAHYVIGLQTRAAHRLAVDARPIAALQVRNHQPQIRLLPPQRRMAPRHIRIRQVNLALGISPNRQLLRITPNQR